MEKATALGAVRGLGSAKQGAHHWLRQRLTAVGNLFIGGWFVASLLLLPNTNFITLRDWASHAVPACGLALLVVCGFWHARLGVQVMIEDYIHDAGSKFACLAALNLAAVGGAMFGLVMVARLAFGGM